MARKKQTTSKSRRKEKGVPKLRAECPVCKWTTRLTTLENARGEWLFHQLQVHGFDPVRQVEDSEDKVAEDTSSQEVITTVFDLAQDHQMDSVRGQVPHSQQPTKSCKPPVANEWTTERACHIACQVECDAEPCPKVREQYPLWLRWEYCTHKCSCPDCQCERWDHYDGIHVAPVRQVEDREDEAACQPTQQVLESAPVRQVKDSEDAAQLIQQEVVTEQADNAQPAQQEEVDITEDEAACQPTKTNPWSYSCPPSRGQ